MEQTLFEKISEKIRENVTSVEQVSLDPEVIEPLCSDIISLTENVNSASDIDFCIDSLEMASTLVNQNKLKNNFWKKNLQELARSLSEELGNTKDESIWTKLEARFRGILPSVLSVPFLYNNVKSVVLEINSTENNEKIPKIRTTRRVAPDQSKFLKPIEVSTQNCEDITLKDKMETCLKKLYEACAYDCNVTVSFFRFAINCKSYVQTVYNIFTISFLIRENLAIMSIDDHQELWIRPAYNYNEYTDYLKGTAFEETECNHQSLIISINPKEWKMMVSALKLDTSVLPEMWPSAEFSGNSVDENLTNDVSFLV